MKKLLQIISLFGLSIGSLSAKQKIVGQQAPLFQAQAVFPDGTVKEFDFKDYQGKRVVLYFYPMNNTPGCTKQAQQFRNDIARLEKNNITLVGISCDSLASHKQFQKEHRLPFILVSDSRFYRTISKLYHAAGWFYSKRKTFVIDKNRTIIKVFDKVDIQHQVDDILQAYNNKK